MCLITIAAYVIVTAPAAVIASSVPREMLLVSQTANLTCRTVTVGCNLTQVTWAGPDGKTISTTSSSILDIVSSIVVKGSSFGGRYICTVSNKFGSVSHHFDVFGWSISMIDCYHTLIVS